MTIKDQYKKERKRIKNFIRRREKKGYFWDENIIPDIPKNITTASVRRLQKLTPDVLLKKASAFDPVTGEVISGKQREKIDASERAKRAAVTRKSKREAERRFFEASERTGRPSIGAVSYANYAFTFLNKLEEPPKEFYINAKGRHVSRNPSAVAEEAKGRATVRTIVQSLIAEIGEEAFGYRIYEDEEIPILLEGMTQQSDAVKIASMTSELIYRLTGRALSIQEMLDIGLQIDYNSDSEHE